MVISKSLEQALQRQNPEILKELQAARSIRDVKSSQRAEIQKAIEKNKAFQGLDVVILSEEGRGKSKAFSKALHSREEQERSAVKIASDRTGGIVFGRDQSLDSSLSQNIDMAMAKAERMGADKGEVRQRIVRSVKDFHEMYRNSSDAEKALGTAREVIATPEKEPDRQNEVVETRQSAINFGKYAKWNDRADQERREKEEEERRLEEERISREERTYENEMGPIEFLLTR